MNEPISIVYNLGRLGQAGDQVHFTAGEAERAALARLAAVLEVAKFEARVDLKKLSPTRFSLTYKLTAQVVQACVVTLEPLTAGIEKAFSRELHYLPPLRRETPKEAPKEVAIGPEDDEGPEEIASLHYDLGGPLIEEFLLAIDPYPRAPGAEFAAPSDEGDRPENPFAALKVLKSGSKSTK
jgi:hypothetical protein